MLVMHHGWTEWDEFEQWHKRTLKQNLTLSSHCSFPQSSSSYKGIKGPIKTSLLTSDCHQQFATAPKQPYPHFVNGFNLPDYPAGLPNDSHVER